MARLTAGLTAGLTLFSMLMLACGDDGVPADTGPADVGTTDGATDTGVDSGPPPEIEVSYDDGTVVGRTIDGVHSFLGVPYAAPPVGPLRWQPPQPAVPWATPRDASAVGAVCPQINALTGSTTLDGEEDCLFVNVFTPDVAPAAPMPVFLWLHGGAFIIGSGGRGAGHLAAVSNTVVVTVNYRLDQLGFMAHPALTAEDGAASGNYGLLDQRFAMQWVRDNISAFGGDPDSVTIAGESAGAVSVTAHGMSPGSAGLFHRAIVESGPPTLLPLRDLAAAEELGSTSATRIGCSDPDTVLECLRAADIEDILVPADLHAEPGGIFYQTSIPVVFPIVDGVVIPESPVEAYAAGRFEAVPWLVGSNGDEGTLFHSENLSTPVANAEQYAAALGRTFGGDAATIEARYPTTAYDDANEALTAVTSDAFNCQTREFARNLSDGGADTWLYAFEAVPDGLLIAGLELGSLHAGELVYLFDLDDATLGSVPRGETDLAEAMQSYWTRMAAAGDPNGAGTPAWPAYETASDEHMLLVSPPTAGRDYLADACDFWQSVNPG